MEMHALRKMDLPTPPSRRIPNPQAAMNLQPITLTPTPPKSSHQDQDRKTVVEALRVVLRRPALVPEQLRNLPDASGRREGDKASEPQSQPVKP